MKIKAISLFAFPIFLSGCANMSGLEGASSTFSCSAPKGVSCQSISGVYANAKAHNLPSQHASHNKTDNSSKKGVDVLDDEFDLPNEDANKDEKTDKSKSINLPKLHEVVGTAPKIGRPIYAKPVVVRVWFAPWEDRNEILHDQSFSYLLIKSPHWNIEAVRKEVEADAKSSQIDIN